MIKQLCKVVMLSTILLTIFDGGGVNDVYATNQGVYRGNFAVIEVDEDSPMTAIPDTGTWYNGPLNTEPQQYDVLVAARGNVSTEQNPKIDLIMTPHETPDFFEIKNGKLVVAEPKPFGTFTMPKGCQGFVEISLITTTINSSTVDASKVGIMVGKRDEPHYLCYKDFAKSFLSTCVALRELETLEITPALCKGYYGVYERGEEFRSQIDLGTVFRVQFKVIYDSWHYFNYENCKAPSKVCTVGTVVSKDGEVLDNRLVYYTDSMLEYSTVPINEYISHAVAATPPDYSNIAYGNGIWCLTSSSDNKVVKRSLDYGKTWIDSDLKINVDTLAYGNGIFMLVDAASHDPVYEWESGYCHDVYIHIFQWKY